ncbi:MAG: hypothetical protein M3R13_08995 [Armatimonadota bacterium]|nr:hypothetical protein [Armatimonadota bacterium]
MSKPLLIGLVVVAIIAAIYFAMQMGGGGADPKADGAVDVPQSVKDLGPATPQPGEPSPSAVGGGR